MFEKLLLATDGSAFAEAALQSALELAKATGAHLRVLSVVEDPVRGATPEAGAFYDSEVYRKLTAEVEALSEAAVKRLVEKAEAAGIEASGLTRRGRPSTQIVTEASDWGADVIVMSSHGRTGLSRLLLGSVANGVVHESPCAVLLVRPGAAD